MRADECVLLLMVYMQAVCRKLNQLQRREAVSGGTQPLIDLRQPELVAEHVLNLPSTFVDAELSTGRHKASQFSHQTRECSARPIKHVSSCGTVRSTKPARVCT